MTISAGEFLKEKRLQLGLSVRDVRDISAKVALREHNRRFHVSSSRLIQVEGDCAVPSFYKVFTLSVIYGLDFDDVLKMYGVDADRIHHYRASIKLASTRPISTNIRNLETKVTIPVRLDPAFKWQNTQLINQAVTIWGEFPAAFLLELNPKQHMYAYIGLEDDSMAPLLRPGSLVMIDGERRRVTSGGWRTEYERPIYFVELKEGYRCGWCEITDARLTIIPHPTSRSPVQTFSLANEAEVIGQVVGVATRLVPPNPSSPVSDTTPPTQP